MLTLTENAQLAIGRFMKSSEQPDGGLRISVQGGGCSGMQYGMALEAENKDDDVVVEFGELKIFVDPESATMLNGITVDYLDSVDGSGFKFDNPNATQACGCGKSFSA